MKDRLFRGAAQVVLGTSLFRFLARGRRRGIDSDLDEQVAAVLEAQRVLRLPAIDTMPPARARAFAETGMSPLDVASAPMAEIIDTTVAGPRGPIPVRMFVPPDAGRHWIMYLHGGGGVIGSIRSSEPVTRLLAAQTGCIVASVDYRLGPEHRHPAAIEDACAAWDALAARAHGRMAVAGDSFGGFLSAHVDHHTLATGGRRPDLQVLIYPTVDLTLTSPSIERHADGYLLTKSMIHWFRGNYLKPTDDPRDASPWFWPTLRGSSPALIATAGYDPLVEEGDRYADMLRAAGTAVRLRQYPSLIHGFLSIAGGVTAARAAIDELCRDIRELLPAGVIPFPVASLRIALADVGLGIQLEEQLAASFRATWDAASADGPRSDANPDAAIDVVIIDADRLGARLADVADAWRHHRDMPGVLAIGSSQAARDHAPGARVTLVAPTAKLATLVAAIRDTQALRLTTAMRWPLLRAALALPPADDAPAAWQATLVAARAIDIDLPRAALRWHVHHYVTPTARLDELRADRVLTVPELETIAAVDGTLTVQRAVKLGPLDPAATARLLWSLGAMGALAFSPEMHDLATTPRRALAEVRGHLRARAVRLEGSTFYDVLEVSPLAEADDIELAYQLVALRFAPAVLATHDLAELAPLVAPAWELVDKARGVLLDHARRGRYHDWLRQKLPELRTVWAVDPTAAQAAQAAFARGQRSLGDGDVHRAMSELAVACRQFPGHPEYEASFAWARYRVQVASGRDRIEAAVAERKALEALLLGCRPWPRALVALALLCAAASDVDAARWHLHIALSIDPSVPAAAQLAERLGMRR